MHWHIRCGSGECDVSHPWAGRDRPRCASPQSVRRPKRKVEDRRGLGAVRTDREASGSRSDLCSVPLRDRRQAARQKGQHRLRSVDQVLLLLQFLPGCGVGGLAL